MGEILRKVREPTHRTSSKTQQIAQPALDGDRVTTADFATVDYLLLFDHLATLARDPETSRAIIARSADRFAAMATTTKKGTMTQPTWRKSTYSSASNNCVELATADNAVLLRDSKQPDQGHFTFTRAEIAAFIAGAKAGQFDDLV